MIFKKSNLKKNISTIQASDINSGKQANHKDDKRPWYVCNKKTLEFNKLVETLGKFIIY